MYKGLRVKLVMDSDDCNSIDIKNDSVMNLNRPKFLQQNGDMNVLKLGFGSITLLNT
jgi:hypothetical protein